MLTFRNPDTFAATDRVEVTLDGAPVRDLNELEVVGDRVWANVWHSDEILRIDPATGMVDGVIDAANSKYIRSVPKADDVKADPKAEVAPAVAPTERTNAVIFRENGYNTLYDKQLRLSQQGEFKNGRLWDGKRYSYDSDGLLARIQLYKGGRYLGDAVITDEDKQ